MKWIIEVVRGMLIGLANVIPGVSGGTIMMSMGIYDKVIKAINSLFKDFKRSVLILLPIFAGMGLGIVGTSFSIEIAFEHFPLPTAALFIGLIFGGIPFIWSNVKWKRLRHENYDDSAPVEYYARPSVSENVMCVVLFTFAVSLIVGLELIGRKEGFERGLSISFGHVLLSLVLGVIASATMIIPGVSGSMVMMILGYYSAIIEHINLLIKGLTSVDIRLILEGVGVLLPFGIGVLIGIFTMAKLIEFFMKKYKRQTFSAILGLMVASPVPVFMNVGITDYGVGMVIGAVAAFLLGVVVANKLGDKE